MKYIVLFIKNNYAVATSFQPFTQGLPLPKGWVTEVSRLSLNVRPLSLHYSRFEKVTLWNDGSLKWVNVHGTVSLASNETMELRIEVSRDRDVEPQARMSSSDEWPFDRLSLSYDGPEKQLLPTIKLGGKYLDELDGAQLKIKNTKSHVMKVEFSKSWEIEGDDDYMVARKTGNATDLETEKKIFIEIRCRQLPTTEVIRLDIQLHNQEAALHPAGVWHLGDPGSFEFSDCSLIIPRKKDACIHWQVDPTVDWREFSGESLCVFQGGSGGPNWKSDNHINAHGETPIRIPGYVVRSMGEDILEGKRASPAVFLAGSNGGIAIQIEEFWQNFPKTLAVQDGSIKIGLFPEEFSEAFELQGGEKKTHSIFLNFAEKPDSVNWLERPLSIRLSPVHYKRSNVFPIPIALDRANNALALLDTALDDTNGFEAKRENIDEYGWRNFGDLYADHETWRYEGHDLFVSHYNNQYDPIYGFARQYIQSGDERWLKLLCSLAKHVIDIDIYHTDKDRAEYNGGLFWHTDHYVKAYNSTHRTYSAQQNSDTHSVIGGGPGGQHCYTNGLKYYYLLTGDQRAKDCVIKLEKWICGFYEGTATLQEWCLNFLRRDLGVLIKMARGQKVLRYQYPLDRGVGNYLRALVDCYELTGTISYLQKADYVIRNTASPFDDINERDFQDVESTWYYTIYLQSLIQYLSIKRTNKLFDQEFYYARDTLLHYADWMFTNETPYMESPERLEFPNETWIAQDIRKAHVLIEAYLYSAAKSEPMRERAQYFVDYVTEELMASEYKHYTRIICILLQNDGVSEMVANPDNYCSKSTAAVQLKYANSYYSFASLLLHIGASFGRSLYNFSLRKELIWFRLRVQN